MDDVNSVQKKEERLRQEIEKLTAERNDALQYATYVGMSNYETEDYRQRCRKITLLMRELERVQREENRD